MSDDRQRPGPLGHQPKIRAAMCELRQQGRLPDNLRLVEIWRRICALLKQNGYDEAELPSQKAVGRCVKAEIEAEAREGVHASRPNRPKRPVTNDAADGMVEAANELTNGEPLSCNSPNPALSPT
jgi:hypothetical protein